MPARGVACPQGNRAGVAWLDLASGRLTMAEAPVRRSRRDARAHRAGRAARCRRTRRACGRHARRADARPACLAFRPRRRRARAAAAARRRAASPRSASTTCRSRVAAAGALLGYAGATQQAALAHVRDVARRVVERVPRPRPRRASQPRDHATRSPASARPRCCRCSTAARRLPAAACCAAGSCSRSPIRVRAAARHDGDRGADRRARSAPQRDRRDAARARPTSSASPARIALALRAAARPRRPARHAGARCRRSRRRWRPCAAPLLERHSRTRWASTARGTSGSPATLHAEPAANVRDGGVIAVGLRRRARRAARDRRALRRVPARRSRRASASAPASRSLKVEYNRVHGFYIEVTHAQRGSACRTTTGAGRR